MTTLFKIVFEGGLLPGVALETAKANLAQLFRSDVPAVEKLFTGGKVALKRNMTQEAAQKYLDALYKAGVEARLEEEAPVELSLADIEPAPAIPPFSPYAPPQSAFTPTVAIYGPLKVMTVQGRIGRLRYLAWSMGIMLAVYAALIVCLGLLTVSKFLAIGAIAIVLAAMITTHVQIGVQRLHDAGWTGWTYLLVLVPFVGLIFSIAMLVMPGNPGVNQYGPPAPPNSKAVKVLAGLWVAFMLLGIVFALTGGLAKLAQHAPHTL